MARRRRARYAPERRRAMDRARARPILTFGVAMIAKIANRLETLVSHDLIALAARFGVGGVFFYSGRTKVDGFLKVNENAFTLFEEDYKLPLLPSEVAAHLAA